ncbi:tripartite-type tricarboxylate transporter receptor subunit TctC [Paracidovorax anthurii]|uniref:Tripartite-type tricarboxylate transporter receptor subunit TctC n=2 Tax=Paracidovorax anthurii TaxID=78229 RepID=A0A328YZR6_9BURK|nr:tripartite tricarboxylate transporter substrate binding protein [Paracidovorax anthurii]RAR76077.1 tripartite-type tricarboxylate transporter receptor subunit TctC [Paracidovorax anthurii]
MQRKRFLAAGLALAALPLAGPAAAQDPKPLEWVVGYAAGGGSDVVARTIAEPLSAALGRPIVITNKPGAGTNIAAEYAARHKDLGQLVFTADFATLAANPFLFGKLAYNAEKDFQPIGLLVRFPMFLVVSAQVPASSLREFTAWAKQQPEGVNWASAGPGSPHHLVGELFREQSGLRLTHVPYRDAAPAIQDVVGGQVPAMWIDSASVYPFLAAHKVKAIGVASPQRVATAPDVPTMAEQGLPGFEGYAWQGLVAPAGVPAETIAQFSRALQSALGDTRTRARLQAMGVEPLPGTPAQMGQFVRAEREKWGRVIRQAGVRLD